MCAKVQIILLKRVTPPLNNVKGEKAVTACLAPCDMTVLLSTSALREDSSNRKTKKNEFSLVLSSLIRIFAEK